MDLSITKCNHKAGIINSLKNIFNAINMTNYSVSVHYSEIGEENMKLDGVFDITTINKDEVHLKFKNPLKASYYICDNVYFCDIPDFEIFAYGNSREELYNEIIDYIVDSWCEIVECNEEELNLKAIEFRNYLTGKIERI